MNSKVQRYVIEALAMSGFCVLGAQIAFMLRPDIWVTRFNCGTEFNELNAKVRQFLQTLPGVMLLEVQLEGSDDWAIVAFRSQSALTERIEWIVGKRVKGVRPIAEPKSAPAAKVDSDPNPLPPYPCVERTRRLEEAGLPDTLHKLPPRFAPKRSSL